MKKTCPPSLHGTTSKSQTTETTNREINTGLDNMMWYKNIRGKVQAIRKEERECHQQLHTKKELARTPGSQARQPEEDQYHAVSFPGGSSKFNHIDSLRKDTNSHTENPLGPTREKPRQSNHQEFGSSQTHRHTDIKQASTKTYR